MARLIDQSSGRCQ